MIAGGNSRTVAQAAAARLEQVNTSLPADIVAAPVLDRSVLVNSTIKTVAKNLTEGALLVVVVLFLLLGKAAGAIKEMAVAYRYGVSDAVDAYQITMTMATWLPVTIVGVLSVVLIPVLVRLRRAEDAERDQFIKELQGWVAAAGIALAIATWFAWPYVVDALGKGLPERVRGMTGDLLIAFAPVSALLLIAGISAARLRAHERHVNT
ncbi:hypothetical protein G6F64_014192 [Rhizopus arrhizus]|uniref:Uncharacterized protein n=1 Tax=Rhizopus oryzae TaxID=64495 RepID=A0A9P7BJU0_RHIOR|nr:hypothetical protein G6F64_014192 [Rhizopus arrhizus]